MYKFYGVNTKEADSIIQDQQFEQNKKVFFGVGSERGSMVPAAQQSEDQALAVFYGAEQDQRMTGERLGDPIPGYSGVNRRI